jgi:DNA-binding transcriptional LysR family regulator
MPDLILDLRFLRYAFAVAEHGSFRRAALILGLPQSTVSRRVQLLEHRLGMKLFERHKGGVRLNLSGQRFLREVYPSAERMQRAAREIASGRMGGIGDLRIGLLASLASGFLSNLLSEFIIRHPDISMRIDEDTAESNIAGVVAGRLDIAFVPGKPSIPGCNSRHLWDERIYVAMPTSHPLALETTVAWPQIQHETFAISATGPGPQVEDFLIRQLSAIGFRPDIRVHCVGRENLMNIVAKGFGLTLTTDSTLGTHYAGVAFRPLADSNERVPSFGIWTASNSNPALPLLLKLSNVLSAAKRQRERVLAKP